MAVAARRSRSACTHPMAARVVAATRNSVVRRKGSMADLLNARRASSARSIATTSWLCATRRASVVIGRLNTTRCSGTSCVGATAKVA